ncbi:MAG: DUF368 domain-containing protein [Lachnospiraceae bacterium]|nr:DUF368 domain-containing protein [Lachnospiraceae bacterium]
MKIIMNIIRGILIGVANVIPGVSGGTMAVSLGIYDKIISSVTGIIRHFKESMVFLLQLFIGMGIGIVGFAYAIEFLFEKYPFPTAMAFIGLIIGGIPMMLDALQLDLRRTHRKAGIGHGIAFLLLFVLAVALPLMGTKTEADLHTVGIGTVVILFFIGMITSATMVVPGVSGSMVLLILGYYNSIISEITGFLNSVKALDMAGIGHGFAVLMPFGIGVIVGIAVIAKLIEWLFAHYRALTYSAILGLVAASPFAIFINQYKAGSLSFSIPGVIIGIVLMLAGAYLAWFLGGLGSQD